MYFNDAWSIFTNIDVHLVSKATDINGYYCGILVNIKSYLINKGLLNNKKIFLFFFRKKFDFDKKKGL